MKWAIAYHMQSGFLEKWTISFWHFRVLKWGQTYKQGMHELICLKMVTQCFVVDRGHDLGRCDRHRGTFETEHYWWSFSGWRLCQIHDLNSCKCICVFHSCKETHTHEKWTWHWCSFHQCMESVIQLVFDMFKCPNLYVQVASGNLPCSCHASCCSFSGERSTGIERWWH